MIASIPSPTEGVWYLGPVPIRAYALAIMIGIVVAIWVGERRWIARGGRPGDVLDIAIWAVPFGIVGARAYHLVTDWDNYFAAGREPLEALRIWEGGLSIWGAIAGGALGGWIAARRKGIPFPALADALAPGIVLAQAIGRWGNYFNNELYGRPTDLPWGLDVHQMQDFRAVRDDTGAPVLVDGGPFHPIFLYESLWAVGTALVLIWADRRFRMGHGRVFALYVALYTAGRTWIENLRIDDGGDVAGPAREFLGMRVNAWVSVVLMVGAIAYIVISARLKPGRETLDLPPLEGAQVAPVSGDAKADAEGETEAAAETGADAGTKAEGESGDEAKVGAAAAADAEAGADAGTEAESGDEAKVGAAGAADADADAKAESDNESRSESDADEDTETKVDVEGDTEAEAGIAAAQPSAGAEADTKVEDQAAAEADEVDAERGAEAGRDAASEEQTTDREDDVRRNKPAQPEDESALDDAAEAREPQR
ncbi:MAG TPA: prolipoprotein diacylglyceryl transferase [Jiangellales bacterium]|nr:prolipoprotein diacylglyceryl transferase [Jiangellales bacterium]